MFSPPLMIISLTRPSIRAVSLLVHRAEVTGVQPALRVDGLGGGLGVVEVAGHHVVSAGADLADVAQRRGVPGGRVHDLHFGLGQRPPDRLGLVLGPVGGPGSGDDGRGFGLRVDDGERDAQRVPDLVDQLWWYERAAGERQPQRGQVAAGEIGMGQRRVEHGWYPGEDRATFAVVEGK